MTRRVRLIGGTLLALAACRTTMQAGPENPAIVINPTPESHAALTQAVSKALGGAHVTLEDDALTRDGMLVVDESQLRRAQVVILGQEPGASNQPERFHLVKIGDRCVLVHDRTERHFDLIGTDCAPR
jgi:hypothetical protein